jgi:hypothetical protein
LPDVAEAHPQHSRAAAITAEKTAIPVLRSFFIFLFPPYLLYFYKETCSELITFHKWNDIGAEQLTYYIYIKLA